MNISLGYSPCPNDTFIFDALVNGKIDTEGILFTTTLQDVETLNGWALEGRLDVTKLSFPALFQNTQQYRILSSGAALGKGVGPLLIAKKRILFDEVENCTIAIPGINTTANLLLRYAFQQAVGVQQLLDADEAFCTNALIGMRYISGCTDKKFGSDHARQIFKLFLEQDPFHYS